MSAELDEPAREAQGPLVTSLTEGEPLTQVESMCPKCHETGLTQFLLMKIPHFKETLIASFSCSHCGHANKEVSNVASLQDFGLTINLTVLRTEDLNRQIVKSEYASLTIPELDLELPPAAASSQNTQDSDGTVVKSHKALLTTVEGLLSGISADLEQDQEARREQTPKVYQQIRDFLDRLERLKTCQEPFHLVLDDPSGNSYVELILSQMTDVSSDAQVAVTKYTRSKEQVEALGFSSETTKAPEAAEEMEHFGAEDNKVYEFVGSCPSCRQTCVTRMHPFEIPYFKDVIIMATVCDHCYYKSNEVKSGTSISPLGTKLTFRLEGPEDLSRDILKSDSSRLSIPEIGLELNTGTLGGRFTTIEGLLVQVKEELDEKAQFLRGDSAQPGNKAIFEKLLTALGKIAAGEMPCTIILDDPLSNSYIQNIYAPDADPQLASETYERSYDQNEDFGLNDMQV